ncbi:uncharacterized protein LOC34622246 [Cyclospora cayetanensis]|uniref:Uncharacterized protein LOC34622246 n=1 Tax=Cyclospora cayetanensis TaxID=88456 RepID=A0A6P6RTV7_9EIME|nr:uncharacterized protein LOC34622246 [Cyclospora cayetanensis]
MGTNLPAALVCTATAGVCQLTHEEHDHRDAQANVTIAILTVILFLTLLFEVGHEELVEYLEHKHLHHVLKVIAAITKEVTVLGFISLLLFFSTRLGITMAINDKLLGQSALEKVGIEELKEESGNPYAAPTVVFELFESAHILVFILMVTFMLVILVLLSISVVKAREWKGFDGMSLSDFQQLAESKNASGSALRFWYLRHRIMNPTTPFVPHQEGQFCFGEFLAEQLSGTLLRMVEIPVSTWLLFIPIVLCVRPLLGLDPTPLVECLLYASGGLLFLNLFIFWRLETIVNYHVPSHNEIKMYLQSLGLPRQPMELPGAPIDALPPITRNGTLCSLIRGTRIMNAQESLFLLGPRGISALRTIIQLSLSLHIVAVTIIVKLLLSPHYQHIMFAVLGYWSGIAPLLILVFSMGLFPVIATELTLISNIGALASRQALEESAKRVQLKVLERQFQILQFLRHKADIHFASQPGRARDEIEEAKQLYDTLSPEIQKGYQDVFHAFAELSAQPRIPLKNIYTMINAFSLSERIPDCKKKAEGWVTALDPSGSLTYPAFTADLFDYLDEDADGYITVDDLLESLAGLRPAASMEEVEQLVAAIAHGSRGELISMPQLVLWIEDMEERAREFRPKGSSGH